MTGEQAGHDPMHFFCAMVPPTATKQEKKWRKGKDPETGEDILIPYPSEAWARAEADLAAHLERFRPAEPLEGAVALEVVWAFPLDGHADGEPYVKRPDTDNLQKGLKDIMGTLGWWKDDAIVFSDHAVKIHSRVPGIRIDMEVVAW